MDRLIAAVSLNNLVLSSDLKLQLSQDKQLLLLLIKQVIKEPVIFTKVHILKSLATLSKLQQGPPELIAFTERVFADFLQEV